MTSLVLDVALYYGMKSRHDILEELDIKCGQLSPTHSQHRPTLANNTPKMVKGAHLCVLPTVFIALVTLASCLGGQIKKFTYNNNGLGTYSFDNGFSYDTIIANVIICLASPNYVEVGFESNWMQVDQYFTGSDCLSKSKTQYETSDGTYRREDGGLISGPAGRSLVVRGEYGYIDSRGKPYSMKYVADANGYHPRVNDDHTRFNDRRII